MTSEALHNVATADKQERLIVQHQTVLLPTERLEPHPLNRPATGINADHVETLKALIEQNGYNDSKPITVRKINGYGEYQIIEGHHRWMAASELGYTYLPCVIEDLDDIETNLRLLMGNQQEGNDPLDIGLTALATVEKSKGGRGVKSEISVRGFAERLGKNPSDISNLIKAASVLSKLLERSYSFDAKGRAFHLKEIHSAPESTWAMLAGLLAEKDWSVKDTKAAVDRINGVQSVIPDWWPFAIDSEYSRIATEPGHAKAIMTALKALTDAYNRLPETATIYHLEATDETREIRGREHRRYDSIAEVINPRELFIETMAGTDNRLSSTTADAICKRIMQHIQDFSQAREDWRPVLTDQEEMERLNRLREIERLSEREAFMPRLIQGDVTSKLKTLQDEWFDLICIDPPYNMDKADWDSFGNGREFAQWARTWLKECYRVLKPSGAIYIFGINRMLSHLQGELDAIGLKYRNWIIWDTIQGAGGGLWVNRHEAILYYSKTDQVYEDADSVKLERHEENVREYKGKEYAFKNPSNIWRFPCVDDKHPERTAHPTQKPIELITRIIQASSPVQGRVLDCFIGSGTTGVACMQLRRYCTGIDQDADYLAIAQSRFDAAEVGQ